MNSWLKVITVTVTCLSISPITCLPLHDVAGGSQRRELLRGSWGNPSGRGPETRQAGALQQAAPPASLLLDQSRAEADDAGAVLGLLLALGRESADALYGGDGLALDDGEDAAGAEEGAEAADVDKRGSKVDDYGHGMFWGKRAGGPSWLTGGSEAEKTVREERGPAMTKRANDEYGFGLFFGKRGRPDFEEDFPL